MPLDAADRADRLIVAEVFARDRDADTINIRSVEIRCDGSRPTVLRDLSQIGISDKFGRKSRQCVLAICVRDVLGFVGVNFSVGVEVREDRPVHQTLIACITNTICIEIIPFRARDRGLSSRTEVAEVLIDHILSVVSEHISIVRDLRPTRLIDFAQQRVAVLHSLDRVVAVRIGLIEQLAAVSLAIVVRVAVDDPVGQTRLVGIACAIRIQVVPLHTTDRTIDRDEIREVQRRFLAAVVNEGAQLAAIARSGDVARLHHFSNGVGSRQQAAERVRAGHFCGDCNRLACVLFVVVVQIDVKRPSAERLISLVLQSVRVVIVIFDSFDARRGDRLVVSEVDRRLREVFVDEPLVITA